MPQQQMPGTKSQFTVGNKLFDVHFEIGIRPLSIGGFYACIVLGNGGVKFEGTGPTPGQALTKASLDMDNAQIWATMLQHPGVNQYPFTGAVNGGAINNTTVNNTTPKKKGQDPPKKLPSNLAGVPVGQCEPICTSYEHFGAGKCASMCAGKVRPALGSLTPSQRR